MGALCVLGPLGHCPALRVTRKGDPSVSLRAPSIMSNTASATVLSLMRFSQLLKYREQLCSSEIVNFSCTLFCAHLVCVHILNVIVLDIYDSLFCK